MVSCELPQAVHTRHLGWKAGSKVSLKRWSCITQDTHGRERETDTHNISAHVQQYLPTSINSPHPFCTNCDSFRWCSMLEQCVSSYRLNSIQWLEFSSSLQGHLGRSASESASAELSHVTGLTPYSFGRTRPDAVHGHTKRLRTPSHIGGHRRGAPEHLQVCVCAQRLQGGALCSAAGNWAHVQTFHVGTLRVHLAGSSCLVALFQCRMRPTCRPLL